MSSASITERKPLIVAFLTGYCGSATMAMLTTAQLSLSIFPLIAFALAGYSLYQLYIKGPMAGMTPNLTLASLVLGYLVYSAMLRVEYPEIGSNLIQVLLGLGIFFWMVIQMKKEKKDDVQQ